MSCSSSSTNRRDESRVSGRVGLPSVVWARASPLTLITGGTDHGRSVGAFPSSRQMASGPGWTLATSNQGLDLHPDKTGAKTHDDHARVEQQRRNPHE